jgi:hypothetical protein
MTINFIDRTDFFATEYDDPTENFERARLYNKVCEQCTTYLTANENNLAQGTIKHLANIFDHLHREVPRSDFIDLWQDEDNANIVYAQEVITKASGNFAYIVALVGKGFCGYEVTLYEF